MGLVVRPNGIPSKSNAPPTSNKKHSSRISSSAVPTKMSTTTTTTSSSSSSSAGVSSRKRWSLFILKQNVSSGQKQSQSSKSCTTTLEAAAAATVKVDSPAPPLKPLPKDYSGGAAATAAAGDVHQRVRGSETQIRGSESAGDVSQRKERLRGLAAIVQDVLSRSSSDLRRDNGSSNRKGRAGVDDTSSEVTSSVSFRMQLLDRRDTGFESAGLHSASSSSLLPSEADTSFLYSQRMSLESTAKIEGLIDRGKHATDGSCRESGNHPRSARTDEYETVVERLSDPRATIRLLAATAVREATRNSAQAREDLWRAGAIPPLVNLLQEGDESVCYMATVALLNMAIGSVR